MIDGSPRSGEGTLGDERARVLARVGDCRSESPRDGLRPPVVVTSNEQTDHDASWESSHQHVKPQQQRSRCRRCWTPISRVPVRLRDVSPIFPGSFSGPGSSPPRDRQSRARRATAFLFVQSFSPFSEVPTPGFGRVARWAGSGRCVHAR